MSSKQLLRPSWRQSQKDRVTMSSWHLGTEAGGLVSSWIFSVSATRWNGPSLTSPGLRVKLVMKHTLEPSLRPESDGHPPAPIKHCKEMVILLDTWHRKGRNALLDSFWGWKIMGLLLDPFEIEKMRGVLDSLESLRRAVSSWSPTELERQQEYSWTPHS